MTYQEAFLWGKNTLEAMHVEESSLDAAYLLEAAADISKAYYYAHRNEALERGVFECYQDYIEMRAKRIPLQYILGTQEFMGHSFFINRHVLIPRSDTECLIEAMEEKRTCFEENARVLDMCTGSGCILLTLLLRGIISQGIGVDISEEALGVAEKNAANLGLLEQATFIQSNLFVDVPGTFDIVVSNPPYIQTKEIESLEPEVRDYEPRLALDGKEDGLFFYRSILSDCHKVFNKGGWLFFEIGNTQAKDVCMEMKAHGFLDIEVKQDLSGMDRVVLGRFDG